MQRWLFTDWGVKLGAALLGAGVWLHAVTELSYVRELDVPLVVQNPASASGPPIVLASQPPATVSVAVVGGGKDLLRASGSDFLLRVKPESGEAGARLTVRLTPEQVESHSNLALAIEEVVAPRELDLFLDHRDERLVPVRPRIGLRLAESYTQVGSATTQPESVRITGPRMQVAGIKAIETDTLFEADVRADVDLEVPLFAPPGTILSLDIDRVHISIDVQELAEYEILNVPVHVRGGPPGAVAEPSRVAVRVRGGADLIGALEPETDLDLFVAYAASTTGLSIKSPAGRLYEIRQITPAQADVVIR